jgi:DNA-binding transcriptional MerR regulator
MSKLLSEGQLLFKTAEIAERLDLQPSVVRFWEKEFSRHIRPIRMESGRKLYRQGDLELFAEIKRLLRVERLTLEGARIRISQDGVPAGPKAFTEPKQTRPSKPRAARLTGRGSKASTAGAAAAAAAAVSTESVALVPSGLLAGLEAIGKSVSRPVVRRALNEEDLRRLVSEVRDELFGLRDYLMAAPAARSRRVTGQPGSEKV